MNAVRHLQVKAFIVLTIGAMTFRPKSVAAATESNACFSDCQTAVLIGEQFCGDRPTFCDLCSGGYSFYCGGGS